MQLLALGGLLCGTALVSQVLWIRHREKRLEHEPLQKLEERVQRLERRQQSAELEKLGRR